MCVYMQSQMECHMKYAQESCALSSSNAVIRDFMQACLQRLRGSRPHTGTSHAAPNNISTWDVIQQPLLPLSAQFTAQAKQQAVAAQPPPPPPPPQISMPTQPYHAAAQARAAAAAAAAAAQPSVTMPSISQAHAIPTQGIQTCIPAHVEQLASTPSTVQALTGSRAPSFIAATKQLEQCKGAGPAQMWVAVQRYFQQPEQLLQEITQQYERADDNYFEMHVLEALKSWQVSLASSGDNTTMRSMKGNAELTDAWLCCVCDVDAAAAMCVNLACSIVERIRASISPTGP